MIKKFVLTHKAGLHARPSNALRKSIEKLDVKAFIVKDREKFNIANIIELLSCCVLGGDSFEIEATGRDAEKAMQLLSDMIDKINSDSDEVYNVN